MNPLNTDAQGSKIHRDIEQMAVGGLSEEGGRKWRATVYWGQGFSLGR